MPVSFHTVRSLNGLKNRAEILAAEHSIGHMKSLDMAAQELGFSSYKKAQQVLPPKMFMIQVKVSWCDSQQNQRGLETLSYPFLQPLTQMLASAKVRRRQRLGRFVMTSPDVLEMKLEVDQEAQSEARRFACQALRRLMFMEALEIKPAPEKVIGWPTVVDHSLGVKFHGPLRMPGTDHPSVWETREGAVLIVDEPYTDRFDPLEILEEQSVWCEQYGFERITPAWKGMHNPHNPGAGTQMSILVHKSAGVNLQQMAEKLALLPDDFCQKDWPGISTSRRY